MANYQRYVAVGRLTRDVEIRQVGQTKVAAIGFVVNNRKKNQQTGEWDDEPCFLDVEAWDSQAGRKLATFAEQYLKKGSQVLIEGRLKLDSWVDKASGDKRSKIKVTADAIEFMDSKPQADGGERPAPARATRTPEREPVDEGSIPF